MKKLKVMFVADEFFTISGLLNRLETFTIQNGAYPDRIEMLKSGLDRYQSLLIAPSDRDRLRFHGISVREIKN